MGVDFEVNFDVDFDVNFDIDFDVSIDVDFDVDIDVNFVNLAIFFIKLFAQTCRFPHLMYDLGMVHETYKILPC